MCSRLSRGHYFFLISNQYQPDNAAELALASFKTILLVNAAEKPLLLICYIWLSRLFRSIPSANGNRSSRDVALFVRASHDCPAYIHGLSDGQVLRHLRWHNLDA